MSEIDTRIRHVTKAGANIFEELGFSGEEAERYHRESREQIARMNQLKVELMDEVARWISQNDLKQEEAARMLHTTRPRVSDLIGRKASKFTVDALVNMIVLTGKPVRLVVS
jgi:predicted XRE-type DNA-binding protein